MNAPSYTRSHTAHATLCIDCNRVQTAAHARAVASSGKGTSATTAATCTPSERIAVASSTRMMCGLAESDAVKCGGASRDLYAVTALTRCACVACDERNTYGIGGLHAPMYIGTSGVTDGTGEGV